MKLLRNSTYRELIADKHNLALLAEKHRRLDADHQDTKGELNRLSDKLTETERQLAKYKRQRGAGGKFMKK